jgi:predicted secreted acid phosphatase
MMTKQFLFIIIAALCFSSCINEKPQNLSDAKEKVKKYYESGKVDEETKLIIDDAFDQLEEMEFDERSTVIFDVDETVLSGYEYAIQLDFGFNLETWLEWQLKENAPAIKEVKRLYDYLVEKNVNIVFLTGKRGLTYKSTYNNLMKVGYTKFDTLICRQENEYDLAADEYKTYHRKRITENGSDIIMSVGDQKSDFIGEHTGIKVKVPNYLYRIN